jgi:hypothetical protein
VQGEVGHFSLVGKHLVGGRQIFPSTLVLRGISKKDNEEPSQMSHRELYEKTPCASDQLSMDWKCFQAGGHCIHTSTTH